MYADLNILVGKTLNGIELDDDKTTLTIVADGEKYEYSVEGDCCSISWIEYLTVPDGIIGQVIVSVSEDSMDSDDKDRNCCVDCKESDCLAVYQTHIKTAKGVATMEYRNDSNGYYGGYLVGGRVD